MLMRSLALVAIAATLSGCSVLGGGEQLRAFEPQAPLSVTAARKSDRHLVIEVPTTSGALATEQMLIRPDRIEASYLPAAEWSSEVPLMIQTLLLRSVQGSGGFSYVGRDPLGLSADYALRSEVVDFQAETTQTAEGVAVQSKITILAQLIREEDARVVASKRFTETRPAAGTTPSDVAGSLNAGLESLLPQMTRWILRETGLGVRGRS